MLRKLVSALVVVGGASTTDAFRLNQNNKSASQFNFLRQKKQFKMVQMSSLDNKSPAVEFGSTGLACCACQRARGLAAANGGHTGTHCGTCYVADVSQVKGKDKSVVTVPKPKSVRPGEPAGYDHPGSYTRIRYKKLGSTPPENETVCKAACEERGSEYCNVYSLAFWVRTSTWYCVSFWSKDGPQLWTTESENPWNNGRWKDAKFYRMGGMTLMQTAGPEGAYDVTSQSKVIAVHSYFWTCADGFAPQTVAEWALPAVEGEPPSRGLYEMCAETIQGFDALKPETFASDKIHCGGEDDDSGSDEPRHWLDSMALNPTVSKPWEQ